MIEDHNGHKTGVEVIHHESTPIVRPSVRSHQFMLWLFSLQDKLLGQSMP